MTLELDAGGQTISGSSVVQVVWENNHFNRVFATAPAWREEIKGEAPYVQLPDGHVLFALLSSSVDLEYTGNVAGRVLLNGNGRVWGDQAFTAIRQHKGVFDVPVDRYPLLVTFTDITDPTTVKMVDPKDLSAFFGADVSLKRITLEVTNEKVTAGNVERLLRWWSDLKVPIGGAGNHKYGDPLYGIGKWSFVRS